MANGLIINGITYEGPVIGATSADPLVGAFACNDEIMPPNPSVPSSTGLFTGSLSAHGNIVAMTTNPGGYNYIDNNGFLAIKPYLTGYMREYWRNPTAMTLGADSAIPAITAVIPSGFPGLSGNLLYYIDLQLTRLAGNNFFDNFHFINMFSQALNWVTTSNNYLVALKNSEQNNLQYYGSNTYQEFLSQGFSNYKQGEVLRTSLLNLGKIVIEINSGYFGTSNSIASILLNSGLGYIGNLSVKLNAANVNTGNIYSEKYTQQISQILLTINNPSDLSIIQQVLKTNVPNLTSPLDYISLEKTSGLPNDSRYQSLAEFGKDIKQRIPYLAVETGQQLVDVIDFVLDEISDNVSNLSNEGNLLPSNIINQLRSFLPISPNNEPITILNVIGMAAGYLTNDFKIVNENLLAIEQSSYGPQIHDKLREISIEWKNYQTSLKNVQDGEVATTYFTENVYKNKISEYNQLLSVIFGDPEFSNRVITLNAAYNRICEATYYEVTNFNRANFSTELFRENSQIYSFIESLPSYATDSQNIATDTILHNMCQSNDAGNIAKAVLNQYKNSQTLGNIGVKITGAV